MPVTTSTDERATGPAPSFKKSLTFADQLGSTSNIEPRSSPCAAPEPDLPSVKPEKETPKPDLSTIKPVSTEPNPDNPAIKPGTAATRPEQLPSVEPEAPETEAERQSAERQRTEQTEADAWEKAEAAKIKER